MRLKYAATLLIMLFVVNAGAQAPVGPITLPPISRIVPSQLYTEPTAGPYAYHQLRTSSALSGSMIGVDTQGYISYSGPVSYSTPVANTLGHGQFWISGDQYSFQHERPVFDQAHGNWNVSMLYGATVGHFNIDIAENAVDEADIETNIEIGYVPPPGSRLTGAIGVEDLLNETPTYQFDFANNTYHSKPDTSYFGVLTYNVGLGRYNVNYSSGIGSARFRAWFNSLSFQAAHPLRFWIEQDGYGVNAGLLYMLKLGHGRHNPPLTILLGNGKLNYFLFGMGIGF